MELPAQLELNPAWRQIRAELVRAVGESTYEIWLAPLEVKSWDGRLLLIHAPTATRKWVSERYGRILEICAQAVFGPIARIAFTNDDGRAGRRPVESTAAISEEGALDFNPRYTFEQFIIGDGNQLAHAASLAVAELPGNAYNPLFLYSPPGLGKTHLLHAIGNYILTYGGGATVRYTTVEAFTNQFISALGSRSIEHFKHTYRDIDVLLIDDVQFLASKAKTEEEFFHTFNALYEAGRQLVVTCDRIPRQLVNLEERLRERFSSGLVAELGPPDLATRMAILRKRAQLDRITRIEPGVVELIATRVSNNIRTLEGALIQIVAYASLSHRPIDLDITTNILDQIAPAIEHDALTIGVIQEAAAAHYNLSVTELVSSRRTARTAWARHVAIHLARSLTPNSLEDIGRAFGGRNHATVLHACRRVAERLLEDPDAATDVHNLEAVLRGGQGDRTS